MKTEPRLQNKLRKRENLLEEYMRENNGYDAVEKGDKEDPDATENENKKRPIKRVKERNKSDNGDAPKAYAGLEDEDEEALEEMQPRRRSKKRTMF